MKIPKSTLVLLVVMVALLFMAISSSDGSLLIGGISNGAGAAPPVSNTTTNINVSTATTAQLVALSGAQTIYVTHIHVVANGATTVSLVYGTGANCGTGTTTLDGPLNLSLSTGFSAGVGFGAVEVVPAGNALCITNSAAITVGGAVSWSRY